MMKFLSRVCLYAFLCLFFLGSIHADDERGNWVKKREWLKQTHRAHDQLQAELVEIRKERRRFYDAFMSANKLVDAFYQEINQEKGELTGLLAELRQDVVKEREKQLAAAKEKAANDHSLPRNFFEHEREEIEKEVAGLQNDITQLSYDISSVQELDQSLNARLKAADDAIDQAGKLAQSAAQIAEKIWHVVDDNKAREMYYQVSETFGAQISSIKTYLNQTLWNDFQSVVSNLRNAMDQSRAMVSSLEKKGLAIQSRSSRSATEVAADKKEAYDELVESLEEQREHKEQNYRTHHKKKRKQRARRRSASLYRQTPLDTVTDIVASTVTSIYQVVRTGITALISFVFRCIS